MDCLWQIISHMKIWILPSCSCVSATKWLHHLDSSKTLVEKVSWELCKDALFSFEQILEAAPHKTAVVQPLTSYLINHPSKTNKTWWALLEKWGWTHKRCSMDSYSWTYQCWLTCKILYSSTMCGSWLIRMDGEWESSESMLSAYTDDDDDLFLLQHYYSF